MITEAFAESNQAASARSLYLALTELASDKQSETFAVSKALISHKAGISVKTAERLLPGLESLGLVRVDRNTQPGLGAIKAVSTYTLLSLRHQVATSLRHHGHNGSKSDKVEEAMKNGGMKESLNEEREKEAFPNLNEAKAYSRELGMSEPEAERFFNHYSATGWMHGNALIVDWKAKLKNWKPQRSDRPTRGASVLPAILKPKIMLSSEQQRELRRKSESSNPHNE